MRRRIERVVDSGSNKFALAGWLSIVNAALFPIAFFIGIVQGIIAKAAFDYHGVQFGPSDLMFLVCTAIDVYALVMLRKLLHELYQFKGVDFLITLAIWWNVLFQVSGLLLKFALLIMQPASELVIGLSSLAMITAAMITAGIINILLSAKLLTIKETLSSMLRGYAYLVMVCGVLQATVLLSPFALLMAPVVNIVAGLIFLKGHEEVEFV